MYMCVNRIDFASVPSVVFFVVFCLFYFIALMPVPLYRTPQDKKKTELYNSHLSHDTIFYLFDLKVY